MSKQNMERWLPWIGGGIGMLLLLAGLLFLFGGPWPAKKYHGIDIPPGQALTIKIFFLNSETNKEEIEEFQVHKEAHLSKQILQIIERMARQPETKKIRTLWPLTLKVRSAYLRKNGFLILDFEKGVQYNQSNSAFHELAAIYSIVRTITANFTQVKQVKFLIGGQEAETLAGHIDISRPLQLSDLKW